MVNMNLAFIRIDNEIISEAQEKDICTASFIRFERNDSSEYTVIGETVGAIIGSKFLDKCGSFYNILAADAKNFEVGDTYVTDLKRIYPESKKILSISKLKQKLIAEYYLRMQQATTYTLQEPQPQHLKIKKAGIFDRFKRIIGQ